MFVTQFHLKIVHLRKKLGLTQIEVAKRAGIRQSRLSYLEKGLRPPTNAEVVALAEALQVSVWDLRKCATRPPRFQEGLLQTGRILYEPFFADQDRPNSVRYRAANRDHPKPVQKIVKELEQRRDFQQLNFFCEHLANGSGDEALYLMRLLDKGGEACLAQPIMGHLARPLVDLRTQDYVGNRYLPAIRLGEVFYFIQVTFATPRLYAVDFLRWKDGWTVIEIDGDGHDSRGDQEKMRAIGLPTIRVRDVLSTDLPGVDQV